jgi:hypothetical protein
LRERTVGPICRKRHACAPRHFGERRVSDHYRGDIAGGHAFRYGKRAKVDQLFRPRADNSGAENGTPMVGEKLDMPAGLMLDSRALGLREGQRST